MIGDNARSIGVVCVVWGVVERLANSKIHNLLSDSKLVILPIGAFKNEERKGKIPDSDSD
jgi:hypothetical protein